MSDNKETIYNAEYKSLDDLVYYTATQVAEIVGEPVTTIYSWVKDDCFGDLLKLNKVNGRRVFTKQDIENIKYIKELRLRNYSIQQTRDYISKQGFEFGEYNSGLVDPKDPLGFEALAIKITQKQNEELQRFKNDLAEKMYEFMEKSLEYQKNYLQAVVDDMSISLESKIERIEKINGNTIDKTSEQLINFTNDINSSLKKQEETISDLQKESSVKLIEKIDGVSEFFDGISNNIKSMEDTISKKVDKTVSDKLENFNDDIREIKDQVRMAVVSREELERFDNNNKSWFKKLFR